MKKLYKALFNKRIEEDKIYSDLKSKTLSAVNELESKISTLELGFFEKQSFEDLYFDQEFKLFAPNIYGKELILEGFTEDIGTAIYVYCDKDNTSFPLHYHKELEYVQVLEGEIKLNIWYPIEGTRNKVPKSYLRYDKTVVLKSGDSVQISPNAPHDVCILKKSAYFVIWNPALPFSKRTPK